MRQGANLTRAFREEVTVAKPALLALVDEVVMLLQKYPYERALDGLREKLEPVELAVRPELRVAEDGS